MQGVISCCCCSIYTEVFTFSGLPRRLKWQRILLPMQEMQVWSLGQEDPLDEEMATLSSILIWKIPCTEEPGSPWGHKESDTTEHVRVPVHACARAHTHTHIQVFQHHLLFHIACGILVLWPGLKSVSPASEGRVLTIKLPGKSMTHECI